MLKNTKWFFKHRYNKNNKKVSYLFGLPIQYIKFIYGCFNGSIGQNKESEQC